MIGRAKILLLSLSFLDVYRRKNESKQTALLTHTFIVPATLNYPHSQPLPDNKTKQPPPNKQKHTKTKNPQTTKQNPHTNNKKNKKTHKQ